MTGWTAAELRECINRCEYECEAMVRAGASPDRLKGRREGIDRLYSMLYEAERNEMDKPDSEAVMRKLLLAECEV